MKLFKPEDFIRGEGFPHGVASNAARCANTKFQRWMYRQKRIYSYRKVRKTPLDVWGLYQEDLDTHEARLVMIKRIKK